MPIRTYIQIPDRDNYPVIALCLIAFAMPFTVHLLSYALILSVLCALFQHDLQKKLKHIFHDRRFLLIISLYLVHLIGMIYTKNIEDGLFDLQVKLSLLVLPFVIFSSRQAINKRKNFIVNSFVLGNFIASIVCLIIATMVSYKNGSGSFNPSVYNFSPPRPFIKLLLAGYSYYNYSFLSSLIHVNYFSMYVTLSLYLIYHRLQNNWRALTSRKRIILLGLMFYFVLFVLILQSRASYFSILLLLLAEIILLLRKSGRLILKLTALLVILALVILALFRSERFTSIRESVSSVSYDKLKNKEVRLYLWENSIELIRENPVFGVGTGDVSDEFNKTFDEKLLIVTEGKYYDLHNEFLQTTVRLGLPGILLLLVVIILPLLKMRFHLVNNFYLSFAIIILVNFSFESMLSRLNGVVFFAYFYSFFSILYSENEQNIT